MKEFGRLWTGLACGLGAIAVSAMAAPAPTARALLALSRLQPGLWEVRQVNSPRGAIARSLCIGDPALLMQLEHGPAPCSRLVLANNVQGATVHYTCAANGFGRTSLRVETSRLAKIDTQGIIGNAPFAYRAEARYVGPCPPQAVAGR